MSRRTRRQLLVGLAPVTAPTTNLRNRSQYPSTTPMLSTLKSRQKPTGTAGYLPNDRRLISASDRVLHSRSAGLFTPPQFNTCVNHRGAYVANCRVEKDVKGFRCVQDSTPVPWLPVFFQGSRVFVYNATSARFNDRVWIGQLLLNMSYFHFITILLVFDVHPFTSHKFRRLRSLFLRLAFLPS